MSDKPLVLSAVDEATRVATLTLNRPEKKNALSAALIRELIAAIRALYTREDVHCIVVDAAGDSFCAGRDLHELRADLRKKVRFGDESETAIGVVRALREAPQITIACVQGYCLGGGLVVLNGCDLAIAAEDAQIGMPEILRGSYGRSATPTLFHARIPIKHAFLIQLTGHNLSGLEAARMGLVSKAVPRESLQAETRALAAEIASRNPVTLEHAKIAAYTEMDLPFDLAVKADEAISHRQKFHTDPLADVEGYLASQRGGTNPGYRRANKD